MVGKDNLVLMHFTFNFHLLFFIVLPDGKKNINFLFSSDWKLLYLNIIYYIYVILDIIPY